MIYEGKVKHDGVFILKELYRFMKIWFEDYHYRVSEKKYSEKIKPEGKEIEIEWICKRKLSDYFRFKIDFKIRVTKLREVEVMEDGVKIKKAKGEVTITIKGYLERDYENRWETSPISKFARGVYDRYIIKARIEGYEDDLRYEMDEIVAQVKSFLALEGR